MVIKVRLGWLPLVVLAFIAGFLLNSFYADLTGNVENPFSFKSAFVLPSALAAPADRIAESQLFVFDNRVVLELPQASWARYADTNSMLPLLDEGANGIEIKPSQPEEIAVGDVISYRAGFADALVVHRVVEVGHDDEGWYALTKGDSSSLPDPGKVRFGQINGVLVAVIY